MQDTAGEAGTSSQVMYSCGHPNMAGQKQDDQLKHTFSSSVRIRGVALKTSQRRWTIRRSSERGSGISVQAARHDDDDDDKSSSSLSSSCLAISTDIPDPLSSPLPIVHWFRQVRRTASSIDTELLNIGSSWSSCLCSSMWWGPQEYITYELVLLLQQCPACLVRLILIVFVMGGRCPYSCCFVGCCLQEMNW